MRIYSRHIISKIFTLTAIVLLGMLQVSCRHGRGGDEPDEWKGDGIWLSVDIRNMIPGGAGRHTRADEWPSDDQGHPDEAAFEAENHIDVDDINLLLFDDSNMLVRTFSSENYSIEESNPGDYKLMMKVTEDMFDYASADAENLTFTLMIVANLHGTGTGDGSYGYSHMLKTVKDLSDLHRGFGYTGFAGSAPWSPSVADGRLIPMAGTVTATISRTAMAGGNTPANALKLPSIFLQRAMAQVRVVDAIEDSNFEIKSVSMRGFNTRGAYLPDLASDSPWCYGTEVVEYGTALADWYDATTDLPLQAITFTNTRGAYDGLASNTSYSAYRAYLTEFEWGVIDSSAGPKLYIDVLDKTSKKLKTYTYSFPRTRTGSDGEIQADFARNHIYQVVVSNVLAETEIGLKVTYGICPWETKTVDIPSFD